MENSTGQHHGQLEDTFEQNAIGLFSQVCGNLSSSGPSTTPSSSKEGTHPDALLYIIVVLGLYACCMVILMVKYIQRENKEARYESYFAEFVKREQFDKPRNRNKGLVRYFIENTLWTKNKEDANCNTPNTIGAGVPSQKVTSV
jgi:hypothetical protein